MDYIKDDEFFNDIFEEKKVDRKPVTVPKTKPSRFNGNKTDTHEIKITEKPTKSEQGQRENNNYKNKGYKNNNNFSIRYQI